MVIFHRYSIFNLSAFFMWMNDVKVDQALGMLQAIGSYLDVGPGWAGETKMSTASSSKSSAKVINLTGGFNIFNPPPQCFFCFGKVM